MQDNRADIEELVLEYNMARISLAEEEEEEEEASIVISIKDITERKRAEEALRESEEKAKRMAQENAIMAEIGRIISSTFDIDEVYERFAEEVGKLLPFDRISINIINPENNNTTIVYLSGVDVEGRQVGDIVPIVGSAAGECMRTQSSLLIQPESIDEVPNRFPHLLTSFKAGLRSMIFVPLISKNQVIGALSLQATQPNAYTEGGLRLAERVGNQIVSAITNAQLFTERKQAEEALRESEEEAKRLAQENAIMAEIGRIISSTFDIDEVYERFAEEVGKLIPIDRISITLYYPKEGKFTTAYVSGLEVEGRRKGDLYPMIKGSTIEEMMRTRSPVFVQTESMEELQNRFPGLLPTFQAGIRSMLSVPLIARGEVIGALHLRSKRPKAYTEQDVEVAKNIANQIAEAIANAQLFREGKQAEEALTKAYAELKQTQAQLIRVEKAEVISRLASGAAHEVKNPLAIILQGIDYLSANVPLDNENVSLTFNDIKNAVRRADNIIKGLLDFSRIGEIKRAPGNMNSVIEGALLLVESLLESYHIEVIKEFEKDILSLNLDKSRIEQLFLNLIINAIDVMPSGGQLKIKTYNKELTEVSEEVGREVIAEIEDTGTGIPEDILDKIFDPFFTTKQNKGGTGLGLSVVRNIVEMHDGRIKIENRKDRSGVRVTLMFKA